MYRNNFNNERRSRTDLIKREISYSEEFDLKVVNCPIIDFQEIPFDKCKDCMHFYGDVNDSKFSCGFKVLSDENEVVMFVGEKK